MYIIKKPSFLGWLTIDVYIGELVYYAAICFSFLSTQAAFILAFVSSLLGFPILASEIFCLVNFFNLMICNGSHGTGSKLKLV